MQNLKRPQWNWDFLAFLVGILKEEGGFLWHTWRLITVFIILVSFRISFPTGNLELKTSVCDSLLWCWDLFQQPAAAWVAQGRGSLAAADICAWTWCFSAHLLGEVLLYTFNTSIPLPWLCWGPAICSPAACILLPALQPLTTAVVEADFRASEVVPFPCWGWAHPLVVFHALFMVLCLQTQTWL